MANNKPAIQATSNQPAAEPLSAMLSQSAAAEPTPAAPAPTAAPKTLKASHSRDADEVVETTEVGQVFKTVKRKYKNYRIVPVGAASVAKFGEAGVVVEGCVDESEAKQIAYQAAGVGHEAGKYQTKVAAA